MLYVTQNERKRARLLQLAPCPTENSPLPSFSIKSSACTVVHGCCLLSRCDLVHAGSFREVATSQVRQKGIFWCLHSRGILAILQLDPCLPDGDPPHRNRHEMASDSDFRSEMMSAIAVGTLEERYLGTAGCCARSALFVIASRRTMDCRFEVTPVDTSRAR
jgi:hypothetical protein